MVSRLTAVAGVRSFVLDLNFVLLEYRCSRFSSMASEPIRRENREKSHWKIERNKRRIMLVLEHNRQPGRCEVLGKSGDNEGGLEIRGRLLEKLNVPV